jgi:hypothetical protein
VTDPGKRRREPAINRALRALGLPPLLTGDYDEEEPMSERKAVFIVAGYTALYSPMLAFFLAWAAHGAHKF